MKTARWTTSSLVLIASFFVHTAVHQSGPAYSATMASEAAVQDWKADVERILHEFLSCATPIDDRSPCNVFLARALDRVYRIREFGDPARPETVMRANEIADFVAARHDLWVALGSGDDQTALDEAQGYANRGKAIIAVWKNPAAGAAGHVALILPGEQANSASWSLRVPNSASFSLDRPADSYVGGPLSKAFSNQKKAQVKIYGHV
jgi:hypothetical protein